MERKILFSSLVAASLVAATFMAPTMVSAVGEYLNIEEAKVNVEDGKMTAKFDTEASIPTTGAFGYGVITKSTVEGIEAIVTTTHGGVQDSEKQIDKDDPRWHNHYVKLVEADASICTSTIQVGEITWESPGVVNVNKDFAIIQGAPLDFEGTFSLDRDVELSYSGGSPVVGASFTLDPVFSGGTLTNVCVNPVQFQELTPSN